MMYNFQKKYHIQPNHQYPDQSIIYIWKILTITVKLSIIQGRSMYSMFFDIMTILIRVIGQKTPDKKTPDEKIEYEEVNFFLKLKCIMNWIQLKNICNEKIAAYKMYSKQLLEIHSKSELFETSLGINEAVSISLCCYWNNLILYLYEIRCFNFPKM